MSTWKKDNATESLEVAVIGMAGRFPGAKNLDEFWQNLRDGVESIRLFTDEELKNFGVSSADLASPDFVKAGALVEGADLFDSSFFGYSPREAEMLDPQQRVFLECAWSALEDAAYNPE
ncbi:MAG TPA: beta-ketoacyl synthase N-terminal-like domain-containing protein, partial [Blastocatellia bacterium]|nr:beta-ketoacyl synthase N-terminal-like domain-containing protein [Blastocatellia bacterium]